MNENDIEIPVEQPPVDNEYVADGSAPFTPEEVALNIPNSPESEILLSIKSVSQDIFNYALDDSIAFLNLADLSPVDTISAIRGHSEEEITDKLKVANSVLILAVHYASKQDTSEENDKFIAACHEYAKKMRVIMKRLCIGEVV